MSKNTKIQLKKTYDDIGPLEMEDFIAVKHFFFNQKVFKMYNADLENIQCTDEFGQTSKISADKLKDHIGDTIKISAQIQNVTGGPIQQGIVPIENIRDAQFDPRTGLLMIDSDKYCLVQNVESERIMQSVDALNQLAQDPSSGVTHDAIQKRIPSTTTWEEFKEVSDTIEKEKAARAIKQHYNMRPQQEQSFNNKLDLEGFEADGNWFEKNNDGTEYPDILY